MPQDLEQAHERTKLLNHINEHRLGSPIPDRRLSALLREGDIASLISSHISKDEQALSAAPVGERLPYNDYTTIDWLHDLVKDSYRFRSIRGLPGIRGSLISAFDSCSGWIVAAAVGILTACVAFLVDVATATVSDWKVGYCKSSPFSNREACCNDHTPLVSSVGEPNLELDCPDWQTWDSNWYRLFGIYVGWALLFGIISSSLTMLTKSTMPAAAPGNGDNKSFAPEIKTDKPAAGKSIYLAAGSGIPEIKTILSGFVIPHILDFKVLVVKAIGAVFAVSSGMCLGKEGPFVHISTCVAFLVCKLFPKYRNNDRKLRDMLSAGCSAGLSVAFGAPIGGVLFSYEEISTYFPRKVLWRAFFCSLWAAAVLKALNPTGTGKLVLFETNYGTTYAPVHYVVFIFLGIVGGLWGGIFCKLNYLWSKSFRQLPLIKRNPVFEVFLVVLATGLLQYPNPVAREPGDMIIKTLLQDCHKSSPATSSSWVCTQESDSAAPSSHYLAWLIHGTLVKLVLTIITFGCKVPSGIIIPALDAGAFFGRLIGQFLPESDLSPGIFAMVGAAAFLAGVSRMTISLCVVMFELTGELEYIVPHMIAILVAKWVADSLEKNGVYDLAQAVLGHPFLDTEHAMDLVRREGLLVEELIPPAQTMKDITVLVDHNDDGCVDRSVLEKKLDRMRERGLMDAGLVLVSKETGILLGYLGQGELEFGLSLPSGESSNSRRVRLLPLHHETPFPSPEAVTGSPSPAPLDNIEEDDARPQDIEIDLSTFVDSTPLTINAKAPMEYAVEMFGKLGLRYLCVLESETGRLTGVIIKKRMLGWLEELHGK